MRKQFLDDVFVCAVEDFGTNSWRQIKSGTYKILVLGAEEATVIELEGNPDGTDKEIPITIDTIVSGLSRLQAGEGNVADSYRQRILEASRENDATNIDAYDADIILQMGMFGKTIYG